MTSIAPANQTPPQVDDRRREEAREQLRRAQEAIRVRNQDLDLSEEEAESIAEDVSREIIDDLVRRGEISFERDRG